MTRYFKATYSDGSIDARSSVGRVYSHAVKRTGSFASSHALALARAQGSEVAPAVEITAKEFKAIRAPINEANRKADEEWRAKRAAEQAEKEEKS